jgi:hypothetical protein
MPYLLLIIEPTGQRAERNEAEGREAYAQMKRFGQRLAQRGQLLQSASLASQARAARVSAGPQGQISVLDGPFVEAKEMIGGFFLLDCASLEEAVAIARDCPAAQWATVEVRALAPCCDDDAAAELLVPVAAAAG